MSHSGENDKGLELRVIPVTPFQQNCSVLRCTATGSLAVVDPGGDLGLIQAALDELGGVV